MYINISYPVELGDFLDKLYGLHETQYLYMSL